MGKQFFLLQLPHRCMLMANYKLHVPLAFPIPLLLVMQQNIIPEY